MRFLVNLLLVVVLLLSASLALAQNQTPVDIALDESVTATLAQGEKSYYAVTVTANVPTQIRVKSEDFNPALRVSVAGSRNAVPGRDFMRGKNDARVIVNPTADTDYLIEVEGGAGEYTLSITKANAIKVEYAQTTFEIEVPPADSSYIALSLNVNDLFLVGYDNRESGNLDLTVDTRTQHGALAGKTLGGASIAKSDILMAETGNLGLLIRTPPDSTEATTVTFTITPLPRMNLDEGPQTVNLAPGIPAALVFDMAQGTQYRLTFTGTSGFPPNFQSLLVHNGSEIGKMTLVSASRIVLHGGASFIVNGVANGEVLVIATLHGTVTTDEFPMNVTLEPLS